uniref:F-box domain-containing protein n=1 Tax=Oryza glumipatula TaxID=40148 RepID=A0A0E0BP03_9ORYZ
MLCTIFTTLEFSNLLRCGTVCATWLTTARALLRDGFYSHPETPCLLLLIADARSKLHLLNLITGDQISLLSVTTIE